MKIKTVLIVTLLLFLCGCSAENEPSGQYMVTTIGADESKNIYLSVANVEKEENSTFTVVSTGESFEEAFQNAESQVSKKLSVKHCELIVVSNTMLGSDINELLEVLSLLTVSLQTRMAATDDVANLLSGQALSEGNELIGLIKHNAKTAGFGGHTALFEIKTAILTANGNFALPFLYAEKTAKVAGLLLYEDLNPARRLNFKESVEYSKQKNLYEGEENVGR